MVSQKFEIKPALKAELSAMLDTLHLAPSAPTKPSTSSKPFGRARFDDVGNFDASDFPKRTVGKCFLQLGDVTPHNINQIKKINSYVLPVEYHARFYTEVVNAGEYAKLAYYNDSVVGAVCCRSEVKEGRKRLYIMMIGVLEPYRRFGVGSMLLSHVLALCENDTQIESVFLHVQSNNEEAMQFYKKFGFEVIDCVKSYYKRITPSDAYLLEKVVNNGTKSATISNTASCGDIMAE